MKGIKFELKNGFELKINGIFIKTKNYVEEKIVKSLENEIVNFINRNIDTITNLINEKIYSNTNYMYSITYQKPLRELFEEFKDYFKFGFLAECVVDIRKFELVLLLKYVLVYDKGKNYNDLISYILSDVIVSKVENDIVIPNVIKVPIDNELKNRLIIELV